MTFDVEKIRNDFPFIQNNKDLIYFDNAATTQKPKCVLDEITFFIQIIIQMYIEVFIK